MKETHNERFAMVEARYLETRDNTYLGEMYRICVDLAAIFISGSSSRSLYLDIHDLAHDAALELLEIYTRKPDFRLSDHLSGYLFPCCLSVMKKEWNWNKRKVSFEDWMQEIA
jgi:hypothetical protein